MGEAAAGQRLPTSTGANFMVTAEPRFEKGAEAYDSKSHAYHPNYVNPKTRRILLKASPREHRKGIYEWRVQRKQGGPIFQKAGENMREAGFNVPALGEYECTLTIASRDGGRASHTQDFWLRDSLIVSIGDSYAAGEGNPDTPGKPEEFKADLRGWDVFNPVKLMYELTEEALDWGWNRLKQEFTTLSAGAGLTIDMDPEPVWLEARAHRSRRSGAALAARNLEKPQDGDVITFLSFARSGAEIEAGLLGPRTDEDGKSIDDWIGNIGQMDEVKQTLGSQAIDALIISIGGNDVGFAGSLSDLVAGDLPWETGDDKTNLEQVIEEVERKLDELSSSFERLADAISELNVRRVYLTEYPTALFDVEKNGKPSVSSGCGIFGSNFDADVDLEDAKAIKRAAGMLNDALRAEAAKYGWVFVGGIAEAFEGRGYCMGDRRLYVQAEESMVTQGDTDGTMHPNSEGHQIYGRQLQQAFTMRDRAPRIWLEPALHVMMSG